MKAYRIECPECHNQGEIEAKAGDERLFGAPRGGFPITCPRCNTALWILKNAGGGPWKGVIAISVGQLHHEREQHAWRQESRKPPGMEQGGSLGRAF